LREFDSVNSDREENLRLGNVITKKQEMGEMSANLRGRKKRLGGGECERAETKKGKK